MLELDQDARELARQLTAWSLSLRSENHRFVVTSGGGTVEDSAVTTDSAGRAATTFTMETGTSHLTVAVGDPADGGTTAALAFTPVPERWEWHHDEATIWTDRYRSIREHEAHDSIRLVRLLASRLEPGPLVVLLLLFGARRLPEIAKSIGKSSKEFKKGLRGVDDEIDWASREPPPPPSRDESYSSSRSGSGSQESQPKD